MKEYSFSELGYFLERECQAIKQVAEGKTFMHFHVSWSNQAGNCTLIVATDYPDTETEIKNFFLWYAMTTIFALQNQNK